MLHIRSFIFLVTLIAYFFFSIIPAFILIFVPRKYAFKIAQALSLILGFLTKMILSIDVKVTYSKSFSALGETPVIYAVKHQSAWETMLLFPFLRPLAYVAKKILIFVPCMLFYSMKFGMLFINRANGPAEIKSLIRKSKEIIKNNISILIFPEGTRTTYGVVSHNYLPGVAALYKSLNIPVVPIAHNSGKFWPRRSFLKYPGTIQLQVLDPIMPGLDRKTFMLTLENAIEGACKKL